MNATPAAPVLLMSYPPIPYPSIEKPAPAVPARRARGDEETGVLPSSNQAPIPETPTAKRSRKFITPFKPPRSAPPSSPLPLPPPRLRPPPLSSPLPHPPPKALKRLLFKPPALLSSTAPRAAPTPAVELTRLERRVQVLRQARRYQRADLEGGKDGESELVGLCERWKEAGRAAAEMLWDHAGAFVPESTNANSSFPSSSPTRSGSGSGGWGDSWGFSSALLPPSSGFSNSWGWSSEPRESTKEYLERIEGEAKLAGVSALEMMDEMEKEMGELPTVEELIKLDERRGGRKKVVKKEVEEEEQEKSEDEDAELLPPSEDDAMEQRDDIRRSLSPSAIEREDDDDDEPKEDPVEEAWNLGKLMRAAGVDPNLFGWDEEYEDFSV